MSASVMTTFHCGIITAAIYSVFVCMCPENTRWHYGYIILEIFTPLSLSLSLSLSLALALSLSLSRSVSLSLSCSRSCSLSLSISLSLARSCSLCLSLALPRALIHNTITDMILLIHVKREDNYKAFFMFIEGTHCII